MCTLSLFINLIALLVTYVSALREHKKLSYPKNIPFLYMGTKLMTMLFYLVFPPKIANPQTWSRL